MLRARLGPPLSLSCHRSLTFIARREPAKDVAARLGDLTGYLGTQTYLPLTMDPSPEDDGGQHDRPLRAVLVADDAIELDGKRFTLPLATGAALPPTLGRRHTRIDYVFRPTDTIERIVQTITAVDSLLGHDASSQIERVLDDGARPPPPPIPPPGPGSKRPRPVRVDGALPPP
jgi:hypothetical protein